MADEAVTYLLAIGTRKGLWLARSADRVDWILDGPHFLMREVPSVAIDSRRGQPRVLVGTRSEHWGPTVAHSDDLGASWHETEDGAIRFPADTDATLERIWQIQPDTGGRPGRVWAGCEPSSLWRSDDSGETFTLVRGLWDHPHRPKWFPGGGGAAVHTIAPHPVEDGNLSIAMSTGGVYQSKDDGFSFVPHNAGIKAYYLPDPWPEFGQCVHKMARDAGDPSRLYAQNHHGVYRSDDDGANWQSIADGLPTDFGFVMLAHPRRGDTAWVVPIVADSQRIPPESQLQVQRTDDAGASWTGYHAGLPAGCWAIVLRDAATVDDGEPAGVYLGTRDGIVYASADEGESFTQVAAHLPDVLSIRTALVRS